MNTAERTLHTLGEMIKDADETIRGFQANLSGDPAYVLTWGDKAFEAAAMREVASYTAKRIELLKDSEHNADDAIAVAAGGLLEEVLREATWTQARRAPVLWLWSKQNGQQRPRSWPCSVTDTRIRP